MAYVDGFVLPILKKNLPAYRRMARQGAKLWKKHGALEYRECLGDDLAVPWAMPFPKLLKLKSNQTVVFAWIVYRSKAHRDRVNARVMKAMETAPEWAMPKKMPFDVKKMCCGGFKVMVEA